MNGFIPKYRAKNVIISGSIGKEIEDSLEKLDLNIIKTRECKDVYDSIAFHPDIVFHPIDRKNLVVAENMYEEYKDIFKNLDINLIRGESLLKNKYPHTIPYNVGKVGKYAVGNTKYVDKKIRSEYKKRNVDFIHVNQGYAKCSMAIVDNESIITSDQMIYKELKKRNFNVLLVEAGHIDLYNQEYGFIGGTMGLLSDKEMLISGVLNRHPDKESIEGFILDRGIEIIYLSKENIEDIGSIICF